MKILQVIPYFTPKRGGDVNVCYHLSKSLAKNGHDVTIITTDFEFDHNYAETLQQYGVKIIPFSCLVNISLFLYSPSMKRWLKLNLSNFEIIHLHNFRTYQNILVTKYAKERKIPVILQAHGDIPYFEKIFIKKIFDILWGRRILNNSNYFIAVTENEVNQFSLFGISKEKIEIIPNGMDITPYKTLPKSGDFRKKYNILPKTKVILYLGRIHRRKGINYLIEAFFNILRDDPDFKLVIVGSDDGYLSFIKQQIYELKIEKSVIITGYLSEIDKLKAYVDADVLVYPGSLEIFGLVQFEAIMCGTPIIVSNDCGCGEIVKLIDCGYVVKNDNINEMTDAILKIFNNYQAAENKALKGKDYILNTLNWDTIGKKYEKFYHDIIGEIK